MKQKDDRPYFYWGCSDVIGRLIYNGVLNPCERVRKKRRRMYVGEGKYTLSVNNQEYLIELESLGSGDYYVRCNLRAAIQPMYRALREVQKTLIAENLAKSKKIAAPILPDWIFGALQTSIFDYYNAIDDLGTTAGFGNVGIIFTGPPGVGKSETMRWLRHVVFTEYRRDNFSVGLSQLTNLLAEGTPLNTNKTLVFIDDIDTNLLRDRSLSETPNPLTSQFLSCLDGIDKQEGRVIIASTNESITDIDPALRRPGRFEHIINFSYPTPDLIVKFCEARELTIDPSLFKDWCFARIDMFLSRYKVENYRYGTSIEASYEKFIHEMGETDETVAAFQEAI